MDLEQRSALAGKLSALDDLPRQVTEALYEQHPALAARFGERGRRRCVEDVRQHVSFLAGAVQAGSASIFGHYIDWAAAVLQAREMEPEHLADCLDLLVTRLGDVLPDLEARYLGSFLKLGSERLASAASVGEVAPDAHTPGSLAYVSAALAGRRAEAQGVVREALGSGWTLADIYRDMLLANQRRLGELWARGEISVAQEHTASAITQWVMARLYAEAPLGEAHRGRVLVGGVEGELHALPAHFVSDLLELEGWEVVFVGTHVPAPALLSAIEEHAPSVLGLSTTMVSNLPRTVALVRAVRARLPDLRLVLGGRALRGAEPLAVELGVEHDALGDLAPFRLS